MSARASELLSSLGRFFFVDCLFMIMKKFPLIALATSLICTFSAVAKPQQCVGLVLSGGGAKGIAHIGFIQALEENDVAIDYVAGTSMGAIVGGLYASGYSPAEMMRLITSKDFSYWSTGTIDPGLQYYFTTPQQSPKVISLSLGNDSVAKQVPQSLISPLSMNFPFMELFSAETAACGGNFDNLFVPLRTVSSNIEAQRGEVARGGSMSDAIRASMSFPIVFCPIEINDTLHYDGGLFDNFPVNVMKSEFKPDIMIGLDVHNEGTEIPTAINQISNLAMRPQTYYMDPKDGIHVHMDLSMYSLLDFPQAKAIYDIGYKRGLEMVDSIKSRVTARRPQSEVTRRRGEFKKRLPKINFSDVEVTGGTPRQNEYILAQFLYHPDEPYDMRDARNGYYRAISGGKLQNMMVSAIPEKNGDFKLLMKAYPKSNWSVDLGGYISSSTTSMLYTAVNYHNLSTRAIDASVSAWIGQSYAAAMLNAKIRFGGKNPYSLGLQGVVSNHRFNQSERLFYQANEPKFVRKFEGFGRANLFSMPLGRHAMGVVSVGYGYERNSFINDELDKIKSTYKLGQLALNYDYNTLNGINYPTSGLEMRYALRGIYGHHSLGEGRQTKKWVQLDATVRKYWDFSNHFAFGLEGQLLASTRKPSAIPEVATADAPTYSPTPSCYNAFNPGFRAYSFLGVGVDPVWKVVNNLQMRGAFHCFTPWRDGAVRSPEFFGEVAAVYKLKIVNLSVYANYRSGSKAERGWHAGVTMGIFILAPKFI